MSAQQDSSDPFDIIGLGFGPANLAIACALTDKWSETSISQRKIKNVLFIEKQPKFLWHPGMMIPGALMQISFLKDLVTMRKPTSPLSFISYLHSRNRLLDFINRGSCIPTRLEFADYMSWVAEKVAEVGIGIAYSEEVVAISENETNGYITVTSRRMEDGTIVERKTKNLVISPGGSPWLPPMLASLARDQSSSSLILHTASYMAKIDSMLQQLPIADRAVKIAVIGSGQSAAEALLDVHRRLGSLPEPPSGSHEVSLIIRNGSLKPSDDSPFVNEIFNPEATDAHFSATTHARDSILREYGNTNYGVVNPKTLDALYEVLYERRMVDDIAKRSSQPLSKAPKIVISNYRKIVTVDKTDEPNVPAIRIVSQHAHTHAIFEEQYDAVICGTGYDRHSWVKLLTSSNLANEYGLGPDAVFGTPQNIELSPVETTNSPTALNHPFSLKLKEDLNFSDMSSQASSSPQDTPPSSPSLSQHPRQTANLKITRQYRILPVTNTSPKHRIYLQGCEETTHGLSDTLLSVLAVRAGEVVQDIWNA